MGRAAKGGPPQQGSFAPVTVVYLILALGLILVSAELFTNGVEWLGRRYDLGEGAVGSILAAVGTALPETLVPIIAIIFTGGAAATSVGVGAILGAPFMLSSLAMLVTGAAVVVFWLRGRRSRDVMVNEPVMRRDLSHFLIAYALAMMAGLLHVQLLNWLLAAMLLVFYGYYVWETMHSEGDLSEDTKPLYFHRHPVMPHRYRIFLQIGVAVAGIIIGAQVFVDQVQTLSVTLGASPLLISLLVTPIATELPEKFNSVLWVRQRKDTLALGNITGAMVFQSTFPVSVGLIFTTWRLNQVGLVSGVLALVSGTVFYLTLRLRHRLTWWSLGGAGSMYVVYLVYVFVLR
jgi:cation:H+ antiporter